MFSGVLIEPMGLIFWYSATVMILFGAPIFLIEAYSGKVDWLAFSKLLVVLLALSSVGLVAGVSGGRSRLGAVGEVIPGALALLGAAGAYLFGKDPDKSLFPAVAVLCFSLSLYGGFHVGASVRTSVEEQVAMREVCLGLLRESVERGDVQLYHDASKVFADDRGQSLCPRMLKYWRF